MLAYHLRFVELLGHRSVSDQSTSRLDSIVLLKVLCLIVNFWFLFCVSAFLLIIFFSLLNKETTSS